jgi:hypothetical protein
MRGVDPAEYTADDLPFTLEHTVLMGMLYRRNSKPVQPAVDAFLHACRPNP